MRLYGAGLKEPEPRWDDKTSVPYCASDDCGRYDGKRCELMGFRPDRICEPSVIDMAAEIIQLRRGRGSK